ncbi:MAG: EAL domain-containing protein [Comamonas sp.]
MTRNQLAEQDLRSGIAMESSNIKYLLQNQFSGFELIARSVKGFVDGSENVTAQEFRLFVDSLNLHTISPGLQGVGFVQWVEGDNAQARALALLHSKQGSEAYAIKPPGKRLVYAPIVFMEPAKGNQDSIGFDIYSMEEARNSAQLSRETGDLISTEKLSLIQDAHSRKIPGFVLYLAVFEPGPAKVAEMQELRGWVDLPFRLVDVLAPIAQNVGPGLQLVFFEKQQSGAALFSHGFAPGASAANATAAELEFSKTDYLAFAGRRWYFQIIPTEAYLDRKHKSTHHWIASIGFLLSASLGLILFLLLTSRDRARALAIEMTSSLRQTTADLNATLDAIPDLLFEMDLQGRYLAVRASNQASLNLPADQVLHRTAWDVLPAKAAQVVINAIKEAHMLGRSIGNRLETEVNGEERCFELSVARKQGLLGAAPSFIVVSRDITERTRAERQVHQLAFFDVLTGLPNRRQFLSIAPHLIEDNTARDGYGAVLMIDIDHLKMINDHWGHQCGDEVLRQVASRTNEALDPKHVVARFGGDELIVVLNHLGAHFETAKNAAEKACQDILASIAAPVSFESREYHVSVSMGVALFDGDGRTMDEIISGADSAMYHAKNDGRNTYRFFDQELKNAMTERVTLEQDMRTGLYSGEFYLVYQPQLDLHDEVIGAEALCRWKHPQKGMISPAVFIDIAEKSGFILQLGHWVLQQACQTLHGWSLDENLARLTLAVNVSAKQLHHPDFLPQTLSLMEQCRINPAKLELELTESIFAQEIEQIAEKMQALKALGVCFSLDDFGTGYSSLNYLKRLPLDQLKIDQSFVRDVIADNFDASIVATIISLGESLGLKVLAEGVETTDQHAFLLSHGCRLFQGYLYAKPLSHTDFLAYLKTRKNEVPI